MTKIIDRLRTATSTLHKEIEKDNLANKIMDHTISLEEYKQLLYQNYFAYYQVEKEIQKFIPDYNCSKTMQLKSDLSGLGIDDLDLKFLQDFNCNNEAEAIGAAYVIEGSAMGGLMIGKELKACPDLQSLNSQQFFSGDRDGIKDWNKYLKFLRSRDFEQTEIDLAAKKAMETFELFGEAFKIKLISRV